MTASNNDGGFSRLGTDPTLSGLRDGTDHPHSALFHALNMASKGSYAILDGNNFDITQSDSSGNTQFAVANGQVLRDGKLMATVTGVNFTQGTPSTFDEPTSSGSAYYLLVVTSGNALAIRDNGHRDTKDVVPNLSSGDIPIAVIRLSYGETTTSRFIQFLTTDKTENSLSIGQGTPTVYSEQMSITSDGTDVTFTGASNTDIKFTPAGTGKIDITTGDVVVSNGNFETPNGYSETTIVKSITDGGGAGLDTGTPVYPTGFGSGKITVDKADATNSSNKHPAIGLVYSTISAGGNGKVIVNGLSGDISATLFDAGSYSEGDIIYLSANIGKMTNVRPTATTDIVQNIGRIIHLSSFTAGSSGTAKILVQGSGRENNVTNDGFVTTNASSITNARQINAGNDISIIDNGAGSTVDIASISTLDSVTTRGNNTANSIIVGGFTNTGIMNLSKVGSTTANFSPANPTIDEYVHYVNEPSNTITLPSAATNDGIVLNIKNVNTTPLIISPFAGDVIDNGQITDSRISSPNIISLDTYESITLQALTDAVSPLVTGWYILDTDTGGAEVNDLTASVTWANVPDANITESSVTQHREAIQDRVIIETGNDSPSSSAAESGNYFYRASGETATFTVPNDSYVGEYYVLMNNSGSSITISKDAGDTLIGTTSVSDGAAVTIICVASNTWFVIG